MSAILLVAKWRKALLLMLGWGVVLGVCILPWLDLTVSSSAEVAEKPVGSDKEGASDLYAFMGAASCSGSACHGNSMPRAKLRIAQNEFYIWSQKDSHAKAYEVLLNADSKRIAQNLRIEKPETSKRCLVCHAVQVDQSRQGSLYDVTEGVTCEACHGPAEKWLGPHIRKDWDAKKRAEYGMYNTKDLVMRVDKCLNCHLGVGQDVVDHELIGAGHPRLKFEIDNYSYAMPAHWQPPKDKAERDWLGAKVWSVGQAVALHNQVQLLISSRKTRSALWPDLIHFDCYACHHEVVSELRDLTPEQKGLQRWRYKEYSGKPGRLVWNSAHYTVYRHVVHLVAPDLAKQLDQVVTAFHEGLTGKYSAEGFDGTLKKLSDLTAQLIVKVSQHKFSQQNTWSLLRAIAGDGRAIANAGFQSAEQAVLAVASLYDASKEAGGPGANNKEIKEAIDALYKDIKEGRAFSVIQFEKDMAKLNAVLGREAAALSTTHERHS